MELAESPYLQLLLFIPISLVTLREIITGMCWIHYLLVFLRYSSILQHGLNKFFVKQEMKCGDTYTNKHFINFATLTCFIFKLATQLFKLTTPFCVLISFTTLFINFTILSDLSRCTQKYGSAKFGRKERRK